ncbi:hypothetical protein Dimus_028818 [Dionaea muscipula]
MWLPHFSHPEAFTHAGRLGSLPTSRSPESSSVVFFPGCLVTRPLHACRRSPQVDKDRLSHDFIFKDVAGWPPLTDSRTSAIAPVAAVGIGETDLRQEYIFGTSNISNCPRRCDASERQT